MKKIGIIGSRRRHNQLSLNKCEEVFLSIYEKGDSIVSGHCSLGGDAFAEIIAKKYNIPIKLFPADWKKYGKSAGFIRNVYIAEEADILIAIVAQDRKGGTEDTINKALKLNKKIILIYPIKDEDDIEHMLL